MTDKEGVIDLIRRMPDDATVADIVAELHFRQTVDEGLRQLDSDEGIRHEEANKRLGRWLD